MCVQEGVKLLMSQGPLGEVSFLSYHYWNSERRAGFHGLAQPFHDAGWKVRFVTTGLSLLSFLKTELQTWPPETR